MMKFRLLCVLTLCIWLGQICEGSDEPDNEQNIHDRIYGVGEQFVNDFQTIDEQFQDNDFIQYIFEKTVFTISHEILRLGKYKIDVNQVKVYSSNQNASSAMQKILFDQLRVSQLILSKQFPPERYNGIINLVFACIFDSATTEEIQSALNYLYGIDAEATKTSFLDSHNFPKPTIDVDCYLWTTPTIDALSRLVDVKPKVKQDFSAVREQFPCNGFANGPLNYFIDVLQRSGGEVQKISACMLKETIRNMNIDPYGSKREMDRFVGTTEAVLSTRLPDETIRDLINFQRITIADTPIDEIEKALEYVYDDVPKSECSTAESST